MLTTGPPGREGKSWADECTGAAAAEEFVPQTFEGVRAIALNTAGAPFASSTFRLS